jgi:diacylglycerol diphosphate phosphatase/phosphatidate phosphatase
VLAALFFSLDKVDGYKRQFSLDDTSLRHTYAVQERVPNIALYLICFVTPLLLQPLINFFTIRSWWDFHNATLGLILGLGMTGSVTQFSKITVGRPRPDVIDRCQPIPGSADPIYRLSNASICTQIDHRIMRDGWRSFPSGHSSLSFAGLGFLSFYLAGKMHLFDKRGHAGKAWLALSPLAAASLVAISRTMDYRHHWHDVLVGSLLGLIFSFFSYRQYFPSLGDPLAHRPYSPRIKRELEQTLPFHHGHDRTAESAVDHEELHSPTVESTRKSAEPDVEGTVKRPDPQPISAIWEEGKLEDVPLTANRERHSEEMA